MEKKVRLVIALIAIIIGIVIALNYFNHNRSHAACISGLVIDKSKDPYRITIEILNNDNSTKQINIKVKDENVWNLIEIDRFYFFNYSWKYNNTSVLEQIQINDDFGEIYKDKLNK